MRCNECAACAVVLQCKRDNPGKSGLKLYKRMDFKHKCERPIPSTKKRRVTEAEKLQNGGHGGQIRGEIPPALDIREIHLDRSTRAARPTDLEEKPCSEEIEFDKYMKLFLNCEKIAASSTSPDVRAEAASMLPKMQGLLDPKVRTEVDYSGAVNDSSHVFTSG